MNNTGDAGIEYLLRVENLSFSCPLALSHVLATG